MFVYNQEFYKHVEEHSRKEAEIIVPYILEKFHPKSIVDFGCAEGVWLSVIQSIEKESSILGLDGDYINKNQLKIPVSCFQAVDLSKPIQLQRKYDLAISLEVAEHIEEKYSDIFVDNLVKASDYIVFSAAIPGQGGTHHVNEQRQSYWINKFECRGYIVDNSVRNHFWNEAEIIFYYKQNILCFINKRVALEKTEEKEIYDVVHPDLLMKLRDTLNDKIPQLYTIINHPEDFEKIDCTCRKVLKTHKKIVIYPFGVMGKICKELLNCAYGVQEFAIVDNILCSMESNIISLEELSKLDEEFVIIECCNNPIFHNEVWRKLEKKIKDKEIYRIF